MCRLTAITHITVLWILSAIPAKIGVAADDINITIDDSCPDSIIYTGAWSPGQYCTYCVARPDGRSKMLRVNDWWHDATRNIEQDTSVDVASFNFTGALCILAG